MQVSPGVEEKIPATPLGTPYSVSNNDLFCHKTPLRLASQKKPGMAELAADVTMLRDQVEKLEGQLFERNLREQSYKTTSESDVRSLKAEVALLREENYALRIQVSSLQEDLKAGGVRTEQLEQSLSEMEARRVDGQLQDDAGKEKHLQQLSTVMVQSAAGKSPDEIAAEVMDAVGMQSSAVIFANHVISKKNSSSYADASTSNGSSSNDPDRGSQAEQQTRRTTRSSTKAASKDKAGGSHSGTKDSAAPNGPMWVKVRLATPAHALQLLRKRGELKKVGFRVEEALSKEEMAVKASYLDKGIPAKVWEVEKAPVSWRRGKLFKLVKGEQSKGRWEMVPLTYAEIEK